MGQFSMQIWGANGSVLDTGSTHFRLKKYRYKYRFVILTRMVFSADETAASGMNVHNPLANGIFLLNYTIILLLYKDHFYVTR